MGIFEMRWRKRSNSVSGEPRSFSFTRRPIRYCVEAMEPRLLLSTVTWIGDTAGLWNDASNWSSAAVPQTADDVVIDQPGNAEIMFSGSATVASLSVVGDSLNIVSGTLTTNGNVFNAGTITV